MRTTRSPVTEIMPDRCTPDYERFWPARRFAAVSARSCHAVGLLPIGAAPAVDTIHQRTLQVGASLEREAIAVPPSMPAAEAEAIELSIDSGHVRELWRYQVRTFEVFVAQISTDDRKQITFSSVPVEAEQQAQHLRGVQRPFCRAA